MRPLSLRHATLPFIEPCLPTVSRQAPTGSEWAYEIKHDGFRFICRRDGERVLPRLDQDQEPSG
jgi:ATP-dependent DNA ligase